MFWNPKWKITFHQKITLFFSILCFHCPSLDAERYKTPQHCQAIPVLALLDYASIVFKFSISLGMWLSTLLVRWPNHSSFLATISDIMSEDLYSILNFWLFLIVYLSFSNLGPFIFLSILFPLSWGKTEFFFCRCSQILVACNVCLFICVSIYLQDYAAPPVPNDQSWLSFTSSIWSPLCCLPITYFVSELFLFYLISFCHLGFTDIIILAMRII